MKEQTFSLQGLLDTMPQVGRVKWIGIRPHKKTPMRSLTQTTITATGLAGDRYNSKMGKRAVTLIQYEHLAVITSIMGREVTPEMLRRNIIIQGLNLAALKNQQFTLGDALLEYTGSCHPCTQMETRLGPGGYNAMRGHGGITARVIREGNIWLDAPITLTLPS